ncbi:hypothetical protein Tco_1136857, partial [Tanacetum coccineum]
MALERPFVVNVFWGGDIRYENGLIIGDQTTLNTTIAIRQKMRFVEFLDLLYAYIGVEKVAFKLDIKLYHELNGMPNHEHEKQLNDTGFISLLRSLSEDPFLGTSQPSLPNKDIFECVDKFGEQSNSESSKDDSDSFSDVGEDSNDDESEKPTQPYSEGVMKFFNDVKDIDEEIPDIDDNFRIDLWSESEREIRLRMRFESKAQLKKALALWSLENNREFKVVESK